MTRGGTRFLRPATGNLESTLREAWGKDAHNQARIGRPGQDGTGRPFNIHLFRKLSYTQKLALPQEAMARGSHADQEDQAKAEEGLTTSSSRPLTFP